MNLLKSAGRSTETITLFFRASYCFLEPTLLELYSKNELILFTINYFLHNKKKKTTKPIGIVIFLL